MPVNHGVGLIAVAVFALPLFVGCQPRPPARVSDPKIVAREGPLVPTNDSASRNLPVDEHESFTKVGQPLPNFSCETLDKERIRVSDLKGKVLVVNLWATWCPPCRMEMPRLEAEVWRPYKARGLAMLAIAREQTEVEIRQFLKKHPYSFPIAADPTREIYKRFGRGGIPRTYVVGADGLIKYQSIGYAPEEFEVMKRTIAKEMGRP